MKLIVVFLSVLTIQCLAYRILIIFPLPGGSHAILGDAYVRLLAEAGHEITYISPITMKNPPQNLTTIDVSSNFIHLPLGVFGSFEKMLTKEIEMSVENVLDLMFTLSKATVHHENVQKLLTDPKVEFDVVIAEWMYNEIYSGFHHVFNCPLIWSSSMEPHVAVLRLIDEEPNPAYTADHMSTADPPFTFWQRVLELWRLLRLKYLRWASYNTESDVYDKAFSRAAAKRGQHLPPLNEAMYSASLMLGNSHVASGQPVRLPQNYKAISGYHIRDELKPLPENLQKIMDNAKNGVIYFSMGSVMRGNSWPEQIKRGLLDLFKDLKQTVIWKFEEELHDVPPNVHIVQWAPQQSILAHRNCILFVTHGGLLSMTETLYYGVPIIGIPVFADQFINMNRAVNKGFGLLVDLNYDVTKNLKTAIGEILGNPRYRERVKELSFVFHDRPVSPSKEILHWVNHVVRTKGAPHLRSPALDLPLYQKLYLDLVLVIMVVVLSLFLIVKKMFTKKKLNAVKKNS